MRVGMRPDVGVRRTEQRLGDMVERKETRRREHERTDEDPPRKMPTIEREERRARLQRRLVGADCNAQHPITAHLRYDASRALLPRDFPCLFLVVPRF